MFSRGTSPVGFVPLNCESVLLGGIRLGLDFKNSPHEVSGMVSSYSSLLPTTAMFPFSIIYLSLFEGTYIFFYSLL